MTRAGRFDRQITIEQKTTTQNTTYGTEVVTWIPLVYQAGSPLIAERFWAEIQDALPSRSEAVTQGLVVGRNQTRLRMRWRDDIDSSMRVTVHSDSDVIYQIVGGPAEIGGRKEMLEMVLERYKLVGGGMFGLRRTYVEIPAGAWDAVAGALYIRALGNKVDGDRITFCGFVLVRGAEERPEAPAMDDPIARHRARVLAPRNG